MTTIQAIAKLMEIIDSRQDDMEPLMVLTKQIAEQEQAIASLTEENEHLLRRLAEANDRLAGGLGR